ncbi:hypothetical protein N8Z47_00225 [Salibacteraceae bacterium]|nr:hypothetical protein [Salibacteraceae bacterium]
MSFSKVQNYLGTMSFIPNFRLIKMKVALRFSILIFLSIILCRCSSSKNGLVQKRLHRFGWTINVPNKVKKNSSFEVTPNEISPVSLVEEGNHEVKIKLEDIGCGGKQRMFEQRSNRESILISGLNSSVDNQNKDSTVQLDLFTEVVEQGKGSNDDPKVPIITAGIIALIIALVNLLFFMWVPFLGILSALLSIVFAVKALKLDNKNSKLYGITSIIISAFTIFISFLITFAVMNGLQLFGNI